MSAFSKIRNALLAGAGGVAALAAVNAAIDRSRPRAAAAGPEPEDVPGGEAHFFRWKYGQIYYRAAGAENPGPPLVLIHAVGVGDSSLTWRRNFAELARHFRVYALDLLGFGFSDKPPVAPYSAELYSELIADFVREAAGGRAHLIANSLGAAYAVRVADERPSSVASLILVAPTGAGALETRPGMRGAAFYGLLHSPVLGTSFYNAMASERSLRDHARDHLFYDKEQVTRRLIARYYALSHQPGAQHALTAFFSGYLNADLRGAFARLSQPVALAWGRHDTLNPPERAQVLLRLNPRATLEIFDSSRALPHEEQSEQFNRFVLERLRQRPPAA